MNTTKERELCDFLPYRSVLDLNTVKTADSSYIRVIKVQGVPFESAEDTTINMWTKHLNSMLMSIANTQVAVWSHVIRRRTTLYPRGDFKNDFAKSFNDKYKDYITGENLYINELYFTIIYRDVAEGKISGISDIIKNIFSKKNKHDILHDQEKSLEKLNQITSDILASLEDYNPVLLGAYTTEKVSKMADGIEQSYITENRLENFEDYDPKNGVMYSELLEFFAYLLNGCYERIAMPTGEAHRYIPSARISWNGSKTLIENNKGIVFGSSIGITAFNDYTTPIMLDDLLNVNVEFVMSQSLAYIPPSTAMKNIKTQFDRMDATEDVGVSQQQDLLDAMEALQGNKFEMGNFCFSIFVKSDDAASLNENISLIGSILMNNGLRWTTEDIAAQAAYLSMLPGNFKYRPRMAMITTNNFSCFAPLHGYPIGQYSGNQWGEAVTVFKTTAGSPYYFNFHSSDKKSEFDEDQEHEFLEDIADGEDFQLGNVIVAGQSGAGKTVLECMLLAQSHKFDTPENPATFICTDSERGMSIAVKAMNGQFFDISPDNTRQTFNPLLLPYSVGNVSFLVNLIKVLVQDGSYLVSPTDEEVLSKQISGLLQQENPAVKRLKNLRGFFNKNDNDGIYKRLGKWCEGGVHGWIFDNPEDHFDVANQKLMCFELSGFLENDEIRPAISMYFFHKLQEAMDKRRLIIFLDEFWQILKDDYFSARIEGMLKRIRKQNGLLVMFTQSPSDFLKSPIARTLIEQTSTQILLPNEKGKRSEYKEFGLTDAEFDTLISLQKSSRKMLIRQGTDSVVAELNLRGFRRELGVFSANTKTMEVVAKLEENFGHDPQDWLPKFYDFLENKTVYLNNGEVL